MQAKEEIIQLLKMLEDNLSLTQGAVGRALESSAK